MPSSHLILCRPLLLLLPIPPSIRVFSNESTLRMRWSKYWSFSFSIIHFMLHFCIFPTVPEFFFFFFLVFDLLAFQFWSFLLRHPQVISSAVSSLLISSSKTFFISVAMFLIYRISFWFFLKVSITLLPSPPMFASCLLYPLETLAF